MREFLVDHLGYHARKQMKLDARVLCGILSKPKLYFRMPKVASATITRAVSSDTAVLPHCYRPAHVRRLLKLHTGSFRFTFVRHPFTRFYSAYKWVTDRAEGGPLNSFDARQREVIRESGDINAFCQSLGRLLEDRNLFLIHFYPQSDFVCEGKRLLVDFAGRYENMEGDSRQLGERFGYDLNLSFGPNAKNTAKRAPEQPVSVLAELGMSQSSIRALESLYARDLELFSYDRP